MIFFINDKVFPLLMKDASGTLGLNGILAKIIPYSKKFKKQPPKRITDDVLAALIDEGLSFTASSDPFEAVKQIRNVGQGVVLLPLEYRIGPEMGNRIVKDICPTNYLNMDSVPVVREAVRLSRDFACMAKREWHLPSSMSTGSIERMTDQLAESTGMYPYFQQKAAVNLRSGNPPIGFYWTGNDKRVRATTWMRCINAHEYYQKHKKGQLYLELADKIYAHSVEVTVRSQSNPNRLYKFFMLRLPIFEKTDRKLHSEWRKISVTGNVPDEIWRGKMHLKRETENIFFGSYFIFAYDALADRLMRGHELGTGVEVQVNPFPILTPYGAELVRLLREQTIIGKRGLNMTEMDYLIGADTITNSKRYDGNFVNWRRG